MKITKDRDIMKDWVNMPNSILVVPCNKGNKKNGESEEIVNKYLSGYLVKDLVEEYNKSMSVIYGILKKYNAIRDSSKCKIKYNIINKDFFKSVDLECQAYFLGFLYADGWVDIKNNQICLSLHEKDKYILDIFSNLIFENKKLYYRAPNGNNSGHYRLTISNKEMCNDILKLGMFENKTFKLEFPNFIKNDLIRHFIRGYFDGDGCICLSRHKDTYYRVGFSIIGTESLLSGIVDYFYNNLNIKKPKINVKHKNRQNNIYYFCISSRENVLKIYELLYNDSNYYLTRKKDIFLRIKAL